MQLTDLEPIHIDEYANTGAVLGFVSSKKDMDPFIYLEYAKEDISEDRSQRAFINAVGNAKRAFHFQVDMICNAFGWGKIWGKKQSNFSHKLDYVAKCGVVSPNILRKLNQVRNKVEHDYVVPSEEEAEDYIDIVELFLMATKIIIQGFPEQFDLELMRDEHYDQSLNLPEQIYVKITMENGGIVLSSGEGKRSFDVTDADYFDWLSVLIVNYLR